MSPTDAVARHVTLRELRLLLAVARSGSILKAANEIGLTQPALSRSIAEALLHKSAIGQGIPNPK